MGLFYLCCGSSSKSVKKSKHKKNGKHANNDKSKQNTPNHKNLPQKIDSTTKTKDFQVNLQSLKINLPDAQLPKPEFSVIDESELLLQKKRGIDLYPTKDQIIRAVTETIIETEPCKSVSTNDSSLEIISSLVLEESHFDCEEVVELEKDAKIDDEEIEDTETVKEIQHFSHNSSNQNSSLEDVSSLILEDIVHDLSTANSCENIEPDQELDFQVNINYRKALSTLREESTNEITSDNNQSDHNDSKTISEDLRSVGDVSVEITSWELITQDDLLVETDLEATRDTLNCSARTEDFYEVPTIEEKISAKMKNPETKYALKTEEGSRNEENSLEENKTFEDDKIKDVKIEEENSIEKVRKVPEKVSSATVPNNINIAYCAEIPQLLLETEKHASLKTLDTACINEKIFSGPVTEDVFKPAVEPPLQFAEPEVQFVSLTRKYENEIMNEIIEDRSDSVGDFRDDFVKEDGFEMDGFEMVGTNDDLKDIDSDSSSDCEPSQIQLISSNETSQIEEKTSVLQTYDPPTYINEPENSSKVRNDLQKNNGALESLTLISAAYEVLNHNNSVNPTIEDSDEYLTSNTIPARETVNPAECNNYNKPPTSTSQEKNTQVNVIPENSTTEHATPESTTPENTTPENATLENATLDNSTPEISNFTTKTFNAPESRTSRHHLFHSVGSQSDFQTKPVESLKLTKKKTKKSAKRLKRIAVTTLVCLVPISSLYLWSNSVEITG